LIDDELGLSGFRDLPGFNTAGANLHPFRSALRLLDPNGLKVWVKSPRRTIVRVRDVIAELRSFAADFATFGHYFYNLQEKLGAL
jgi:hypothetical protein